jgi:E3 ubiquitin-protein ligase SHPRH
MDVCITTYDVLQKELTHVTSVENMKVLRHAKRFMTIPSPLICIEWWRVCLDEGNLF